MNARLRVDSITIWVCICCMLIHANGECCDSDDHGGDGIEPWSDVDQSKFDITMGLLAEEHNIDCEVYKTGSRPADYECDCEHNTFSHDKCHGCGSWLAGDRYAFALWSKETN